MKAPVFVILLFVLKLSFSQNTWPPIGAFWNYSGDTVSYIGNQVDAELTVYVVDTIEINGYVHKITRQVGHEVIFDGTTNIVNKSWDEMVCCLLNRNDSIFNVDPHFKNEQFLFSFKSDVGDSMNINQTIPYVVDTITYEVVASDTLRKINYIKNCPGGKLGAFVLEKVGPLSIEDTIHPDSVCLGGFGDSFVWHFNCYSGNGIEYPSSCLPIKTGVKYDNTIRPDLEVSLNNNNLRVCSTKSRTGFYRVINMNGQLVFSDNFYFRNDLFETDIHITAGGIYLIQVQTSKGESQSIKVILSN